MMVDLIRFTTKDKMELAGFLVGPKATKRIVLYVHGLGSKFYQSKRTEVMAQTFKQAGWAFLSFNNRGHDRLADSENFTKCVDDIAAAINFARRQGFREIILMGHSTGCNKIVYALSKKKFPSVYGVILLAGLSDPDIYKKELGRGFGLLLRQAESLVKKHRGQEYLLAGKHGAKTAARLVSLLTYGGAEDLFSLSLDKKAKMRFRGLTMPTLIVYGTRDPHACYDVRKIGAFVAKQIPGPFQEVYIKGADHGFRGKERQLMLPIIKWLGAL